MDSDNDTEQQAGCRAAAAPGADRETDHRITNSLSFLAAMLRFESRAITSVEEARASLQHAAGRLRAMARLHRALTAPPETSEVGLSPYLTQLCADISESTGAVIEVQADDVPARVRQLAQLGIALNELASNAVKHGDQDGYPVVVHLSVTRQADGTLRAMVTDNGPGLPDGFDITDTSGLGMRIVQSTLGKLGGTIRVAEAGARSGFEITLPADPQTDPP